MKLAAVLLLLASLVSVLSRQPSVAADDAAPLAYPEGYRDWAHVKSTLISPAHKRFASIGGFQHIYANAEGMTGYRTGAFPEGSIVVFDWLEMRDNAGAFEEGARRQVDVMVKDERRFATTGGWGFQRFVKDSRTELAVKPTPQECFACHDRLKKSGLILSTYRP